MNYFKINYGSNDDNYDVILANNKVENLNTFKEDIQKVLQSKVSSLIESKEEVKWSTFVWVELSVDNLIKLGYIKVNCNSIVIKYSLADEDNNIKILVDEALVKLGTEKQQNATLFQVVVFSEFDPGNTFSSYFLSSQNDLEKFNLEIINYLNLNPIIYNSEILLYLEALEGYMVSKGYQIINPLTFQISCSHNSELLTNQWKEILGKELYSKITTIKKPNIIKNKLENIIVEGELPF